MNSFVWSWPRILLVDVGALWLIWHVYRTTSTRRPALRFARTWKGEDGGYALRVVLVLRVTAPLILACFLVAQFPPPDLDRRGVTLLVAVLLGLWTSARARMRRCPRVLMPAWLREDAAVWNRLGPASGTSS